MQNIEFSTVLKWTRLIVGIVLIIILIISFAYQRIDIDTLLRAVISVLAMNNLVGALATHQMNGSGKGQ